MIEISLLIIILVTILIIGLLIYLILYSNTNENFSSLDSQLDNTVIFVICRNCDTPDSTNQVIKKLDKQNINYRIYKPINREIVDMKKLVFQGVIKIRDTPVTKDSYSWFMSNVNMWEIFLKSNRNFCIILNDNTNLPDDFKEIMKQVVDDLSISRLDGVMLTETIYNKKNITKNTKNIIHENQLGTSTDAYILTREGARKLINNTIPIVSSIGDYFNAMNLKGIVKIGKTTKQLLK